MHVSTLIIIIIIINTTKTPNDNAYCGYFIIAKGCGWGVFKGCKENGCKSTVKAYTIFWLSNKVISKSQLDYVTFDYKVCTVL